MKVLITGAGGFVGQQLTERLMKDDDLELILLDKVPKPIDMSHDGQYMHVDLAVDQPTALHDFEGVVVHLAAARSDDEKLEVYQRDNLVATQNLLNILDARTLIKFIHVSSVASIDGSRLDAGNLDLSLSSDDLYRLSKFKQENLVKQWCTTHKVNYCGLLPSAIHATEYRKDTNIGRLQRLLQFMPVLPEIPVRKSLTSLYGFCEIISSHIPKVDNGERANYEEYLTIDLPVQTVTEIMMNNSVNKKIVIRIIGLRLFLTLSSILIERLGLSRKIPLTRGRVEKLFRDTSYDEQTRYSIITTNFGK